MVSTFDLIDELSVIALADASRKTVEVLTGGNNTPCLVGDLTKSGKLKLTVVPSIPAL